MCQPTNFNINYQINPWMKLNSVNLLKAQKQWLALVNIYQKLKLEISTIHQDHSFPDMVFTTDSFISYRGKALISNFRFSQRQPEPNFFIPLLKLLNMEIVNLPQNYHFEGGDFRFFNKKLFLGTNFRTDKKSIPLIKSVYNVPIIPLELINPYFYHLDTCLFILNPNNVFYIKKAFSLKSRKVLNQHFPNLHEINQQDADNFAANSVVIGKNVISNIGLGNFKNKIQDLGYTFWETDMSEFIKSGGSVHCLTNLFD